MLYETLDLVVALYQRFLAAVAVNQKLGPLVSSWLPGLVWPEMGPMVNGTCQRIGLKEEDGDIHWTHEVSSCSC
jgi:hypothetical protein